MHVANSVYAADDNKKAIILVSLDILTAFNTINHLENQFGVDGVASSWLCLYLSYGM